MTVVTVNLLTIAIILAAGFPNTNDGNWHPFVPNGLDGVFRASSIVFFSYIGFDGVATAAEEVKNPQRDLPIGIVGSLFIATILYVLMSLGITGMQK